jgi:cytochrome c
MPSARTLYALPILALAFSPGPAAAVDVAAAEALLKASKCMTCHSVDKKKDGPPYAETAKKYAGDAGARQKIIDWLSAEHDIEIDGEADTHPMAKTEDAAAIGNLADWILSR